MNFEKSLERLKEICSKIGDEKTPLEETAKLYKEGIALSDECLRLISEIKQELQSKEE